MIGVGGAFVANRSCFSGRSRWRSQSQASLVVQVLSFKLTEAVFRHVSASSSFELTGWEVKRPSSVRFWISIIFALLGLATLKLR